jgi:hypothetical protein
MDSRDHAAYMRWWRAQHRPTRIPELDWPKNAFGHDMRIEELMADGDYKPPKIGRVTLKDLCACGCQMAHNNGQSRTVRSALGNSWEVIWYRAGHLGRPMRVGGAAYVGG